MRDAGYDGGYGDGDGDRAERAAERETELEALAVRAATGDPAALDRFLHLIRQPVVRYCRARLGHRSVGLQTAEDVAQDVLVGVCGALARYRPGETRMMAFVFGIARKKVVDAYRASGRDHSEPTETLPEGADTDAGPEAQAVLASQVDELRTLLEELPEHHREVLVLRVALNFSAEETALTVGSSAGAVRVTQHRAIATLRTRMRERKILDEF